MNGQGTEIPREHIGAVIFAALGLVQELLMVLHRNGALTDTEIDDVFANAIAAQMQVRSETNVAAARLLMHIEDAIRSSGR